MKRIDWSTLDDAGRREALARPRRRTEARVTDTVREIMEDVRRPRRRRRDRLEPEAGRRRPPAA
jgi:hypothetical protein